MQAGKKFLALSGSNVNTITAKDGEHLLLVSKERFAMSTLYLHPDHQIPVRLGPAETDPIPT